MLVEYEGGKTKCNSHEDVREVLKLRNENNENEFCITINECCEPCMMLIAKNNLVHVSYFPFEENYAGFIALDEKVDSSEEIEVVIGGFGSLSRENMIEFSEAVTAVLQFYDNSEMPTCLKWFEL